MKKIIALIALMLFSFATMAQKTKKDTKEITSGDTKVSQEEKGAKKEVTASTAINPDVDDIRTIDHPVENYYDRMDDEKINSYSLSKEQRSQLNAVDVMYSKRITGLKEDKRSDVDVWNARYNEYRAEKLNNYFNLLSGADKDNFQSYMDQWNYNYMNWQTRTDLNLTQDQINKLNDVNNRFLPRELMIVNGSDEKGADKESNLTLIMREKMDAYNKIFTSDQLVKIKTSNGRVKEKTRIESTQTQEKITKVSEEVKNGAEASKVKEKTKVDVKKSAPEKTKTKTKTKTGK